MTDPQQQAMPPLPEPHRHSSETDDGLNHYTSHQMRAYAAEAVARALDASAPSKGAVAWRWVPSEVWRDWVVTLDPKQAQQASAHGFLVEALGVIGEAPSREAPEGWKLVPVEPTPRMLAAHWDEALDVCLLDHFANAARANEILTRAYAAMLAAAPSTSGEGGKEGDDHGS